MGQKRRGLGHLTYFKFWDTLYIAGTAKATNLRHRGYGLRSGL